MSAPKTVLITSASGNIGRELAPLLLSQSPETKVVLPTRSVEKLRASLGALAGSNAVFEDGTMQDPAWFQSILAKHNVEGVFLCATGSDEMVTIMHALDACSRVASVKKVVYLSIMGDFTSPEGLASFYRERSHGHIFTKPVVEQKLQYAEYPFKWTILGPSMFFENDLRQKPMLLNGAPYMEPSMRVGVVKTSTNDIALAAKNALLDTTGKWDSKKVSLCTRQSYTTDDVAKLWAEALGRPAPAALPAATEETYEKVEQTLRKFAGGDPEGLGKARSLRLMYEWTCVYGLHVTEEDYKPQIELLGREPDDYPTWIKKTAASWQ